ncbi:secreted protein/lipoprotein [Streptomyces sp. NPDC002491]
MSALILVSGLLALAGCSNSGSDTSSKPSFTSTAVSPSSAAPATADPEDAVKKAAVAAYEVYWREMEKLYADPTGKSAHLNQYAAAAALKNAEADAKRAHGLGSIYTGSIVLTDQTVTKVVATGRIPNATVSSCLDISSWQTVDAKTKKPVPLPSNRLTKYRIVSTVEKYAEGWRVTSDEPQGKPC